MLFPRKKSRLIFNAWWRSNHNSSSANNINQNYSTTHRTISTTTYTVTDLKYEPKKPLCSVVLKNKISEEKIEKLAIKLDQEKIMTYKDVIKSLNDSLVLCKNVNKNTANAIWRISKNYDIGVSIVENN